MALSLATKTTRQPTDDMIEAYYAAMRPFWHPVLPSAQLGDAPVAVELLAEPLVVARLNGTAVAMQDVCRHFQAQLSLGEIRRMPDAGDCLMCPYHGWTFDQTGRCVDIPQLGAGRGIPRDARVPTYRAAERYGLIWVCLEPEPTYPLPTLPLVDDPAFLPGPLRAYPTWTASAPRVIMAALDDTHGPWVHGGTLGSRDHPAPPDHKVERDGQYLKVRFTMLQPTNTTIGDGGDGMRPVSLTTTVGIPNLIHFAIRPLDSTTGRCTVIWQAVAPRRYNATDTFWGSARNYDTDAPAWDAAFESFQDTVREQDRRVVESQRPWLLPPFWSKVELPLRPADLPLIEYHLWLEELGIAVSI
jgi:phenylpropionate dioxygenase-like ring-hydroxylating dioxygenase large terminal subunit